ncbi:MAG TPA: FliA/WhiG family RNA polymerase sigma factor [Opitutaceae bacterium]|jgi:RNA polymerase sigma factor FliA|nr:MAG: RNA polymerase sigma-D factor [Verrucomicrobia bacterium ADurb.Bin122]HNW42272.1 FliA/WhiG family RNA polymerase sigma factor [Opitutaceae bacterium]HOD46028.1 FliA/WhiG family RNA polymerase sigma factor [Opitutaceae bacterium]HOF08466.1 FliA/WhiG family RNA polymerase sigma factor [Opitutaceae bacterium]HOG92689.1 FliA/WhiG family RNA polymerase sigma factor [Opitutaceae bacterium]
MKKAMNAAPVLEVAPQAASAWRVYQGTSGSLDEKDLIERFLPLVRNVVDRIKLNLPPHVDADDLYSVGVTGLIAAVKKYDPAQGHTFAAYATTRIRGSILDELRRMDWCPRRARAKARKLKEAIIEVEQRLGRAATEEEVRTHLGLSAKEYAKWMEEAKPVCFVNIDATTDHEDSDGASLHELIADESDVSVRDRMEKDELMKLVAQRIEELPDIPKKILSMYYFENMRLAEIATVFSLTESRICQIHAQTVLGLRAYIQRVRNR